MEKIIEQVIRETEKRINHEIAECKRIEAECRKPFPSHGDTAVYAQYVLDRRKGGKYDTSAMSRAMYRQLELQGQLADLKNFEFELNRSRR